MSFGLATHWNPLEMSNGFALYWNTALVEIQSLCAIAIVVQAEKN